MVCYKLEKERRVCLGECQFRGWIGNLSINAVAFWNHRRNRIYAKHKILRCPYDVNVQLSQYVLVYMALSVFALFLTLQG